MNYFKDLPNWAKALLAFVAIVAGVSGYDILFKGLELGNTEQSSQNSKSSEFKRVNIIIKTRNSQPVPNTQVEIITDGPPISKTSDSNGYVEVEIPVRKTVEINLSKPGFVNSKYLMNLEVDPNTTKTLYIDQKPNNK